MADYGIHGIFLQRNVCELEEPKLRYARDVVANRIRLSSERHCRCFAIMYDIEGANMTTVCAGSKLSFAKQELTFCPESAAMCGSSYYTAFVRI